LFWFAQYIYTPFLSPYMAAVGISATIIGSIAGVYGLAQLVLRIPLSIVGRMAGSHKLVIGGGLIIVFVSCILPMFSHSWLLFFVMRALSGVASSTWISYTAYQLEGAGEQANRRMGFVMACNTGGICISQIIGTLTYSHIGINGIFIIGAAGAGLAFVLLLLTPFRKPDTKVKTGTVTGTGTGTVTDVASDPDTRGAAERGFTLQMFTEVLKNRHLWICSVLMSLAWWVMFSTNYSFTGVFAQDALSAKPIHFGLIAFTAQIASVTTSLIFGRIGKKKLPERAILTVSFIGCAVYAALTGICTSANALVALQLLGGLMVAVPNVILFANAGRELSDKQQILSMGVFQSIYSIGMTAGPAITGAFYDKTSSYPLTFLVIAGVAAVAAVMSGVFYRTGGRTVRQAK
jgi:MFS family permease